MKAVPARDGAAPARRRRAAQRAGLEEGEGAAPRRRLRRARSQIARGQVEAGAHVLDVCVALNERDDEGAQMRALAKLLAQSVDAPLMIDSTEPDVVEGALKVYPGRCIVNSVNLEKSGERVKKVLPLVRRYGAAVVAMTIDEKGMAQTAERKAEIARRIVQVAAEYGIAAGRARLRRAHLHARHRRRGVPPQRGRDARGHPPHQGGEPGRLHHPRRLERLLRPREERARGRELGLPVPRGEGRPRPRHREPEGHPRLPADRRGRADARRGPRLRPAPGRARPPHRPLRREGRGEGGRRPRTSSPARAPRSGSTSRSSTAARRGSRRSSTTRSRAARRWRC